MIKCEDCKEREGIVEFCESITDYTHGFKKNICRQCYIKRIETKLKDINQNLKEQKKLLAEENVNTKEEKNGR